MIIFLVGFMGSGKNFWAEKLSKELSIPWIDLDSEIEKKESGTIPEIFSRKGETYFRETEATVLRSVTLDRKHSPSKGSEGFSVIIATGGGTPCFYDNMKWMNEHGLSVWLNPSVEEICDRLKFQQKGRPLIKDLDQTGLKQFVISKIDERQEFYRLSKLEIKNTNIAVTAFINLIIHAQKSD